MHVIVLFIARLFFYGYGYRGQQAGARGIIYDRLLCVMRTNAIVRYHPKDVITALIRGQTSDPAWRNRCIRQPFDARLRQKRLPWCLPAGRVGGQSQNLLVCESSQVTMYMSKIHKIR